MTQISGQTLLFVAPLFSGLLLIAVSAELMINEAFSSVHIAAAAMFLNVH